MEETEERYSPCIASCWEMLVLQNDHRWRLGWRRASWIKTTEITLCSSFGNTKPVLRQWLRQPIAFVVGFSWFHRRPYKDTRTKSMSPKYGQTDTFRSRVKCFKLTIVTKVTHTTHASSYTMYEWNCLTIIFETNICDCVTFSHGVIALCKSHAREYVKWLCRSSSTQNMKSAKIVGKHLLIYEDLNFRYCKYFISTYT